MRHAVPYRRFPLAAIVLLPFMPLLATHAANDDNEAKAKLARALTLHASFDDRLDADYSTGDKTCYVAGSDLKPAAPTAEVKLAPDAGRFGGALHFTKKNNFRPAFKDTGGMLGYNDKNWSAAVSVWLRLNPDQDLEPGYCDPVQ